MAAVLGHVARFACGDVGVLTLVAERLLRVDLPIGNACFDAVLLVRQALVDLVDAAVAGNVDRADLGGSGGAGKQGGHAQSDQIDMHGLHDGFLVSATDGRIGARYAASQPSGWLTHAGEREPVKRLTCAAYSSSHSSVS